MDIISTRNLLQQFAFEQLFIEQLGWSFPPVGRRNRQIPISVPNPVTASQVAANSTSQAETPDTLTFLAREIAQLSGVSVMEVACGPRLPTMSLQEAIHRAVTPLCYEHLLIFVNDQRNQSLWYWNHRQHPYFKGQSGDLFLSKLASMVFEIADFQKSDTGDIHVMDVIARLKKALDVSQVTKDFYEQFSQQHTHFVELIQGIAELHKKRWYASVVLSRLMFIYFLQKKGFLDHGDRDYLQTKLNQSQARGKDLYYRGFLRVLFFEGFAKPENDRKPKIQELLGDIRYLNGGLFLPHELEQKKGADGTPVHPVQYEEEIQIPDAAFEEVFHLFNQYTWHLDDTPGGNDKEINPSVLGYIFEKYITGQKAAGAYYTCSEITSYLCEQTIHRVIVAKANAIARPRNNHTPPLSSVAAIGNRGALQNRKTGKKPKESSLPTELPELCPTAQPPRFADLQDLLSNLDENMALQLVCNELPGIRILDPACGSGAFLLAALTSMLEVYTAIVSQDFFDRDNNLRLWKESLVHTNQPVSRERLMYAIKKQIITNNLFGVDIMKEATEIARLRLFLSLVASVEKVEELEPLPNIDFNIMHGNSLLGLMHVKSQDFECKHQARGEQGNLFIQSYAELVAEKQRAIATYHDSSYGKDLTALRDHIQELRQQAMPTLNELLLAEFNDLKIKFEDVGWDVAANKAGKGKKRPVEIQDIEILEPFHWGYEFPEILARPNALLCGFDVIVTNPPWETFKPIAKEFFDDYCAHITKNKMMIHDFEQEQERLLQDPEIRKKWQEYLSRFPHISAYFRSAPQYSNQISKVSQSRGKAKEPAQDSQNSENNQPGKTNQPDETSPAKEKKAGTDINLYKLFLERCFNLLRSSGQCGIVIPSGIYTDLGTKQLRMMLLDHTQITGLFCFENRKAIFEGVHRSFKFVVLSFQKGGATQQFPAAFMRHDVKELAQFPRQGAVAISKDLIQRLSPDSLSIMEFKNGLDFSIAEKMLRFPFLGEHIPGSWNLMLAREFDMTNDSDIFQTTPGPGCLSLYEGKMIHQFNAHFAQPRYWVNEQQGRARILGREKDEGQILDYQIYRLAFRDVAASTNERTMISTVIPPLHFFGHTMSITQGKMDGKILLYACAVFNSFVFDYAVRQKVTSHLSFFYLYQLPVPRLSADSPWFMPIMTRAASLICTTPEFDDLAREVGLSQGVTEPAQRQTLRAELDGLVAHLYSLTPPEFEYILSTFPQVAPTIKTATMNAYRLILESGNLSDTNS